MHIGRPAFLSRLSVTLSLVGRKYLLLSLLMAGWHWVLILVPDCPKDLTSVCQVFALKATNVWFPLVSGKLPTLQNTSCSPLEFFQFILFFPCFYHIVYVRILSWSLDCFLKFFTSLIIAIVEDCAQQEWVWLSSKGDSGESQVFFSTVGVEQEQKGISIFLSDTNL